jgi:hypothetical protein
MNKYRLCEKFTGLLMIGIFLISFCLPGFAEASNENYSMNTVFEEYGDVSLNDIIYQENFEDGDITVSDPGLVNGMTWTFHGSVETGSVKSYDSKMIRLNAGAYVLSEQVVNHPEYTVSFTSINWYNTAARVMVAYRDENNYYSFSPVTGQIWRIMDGIEEELGTDNVRRLISSPRQNPSVNHYKIYFYNNGSSITISADRDGFENRKDYEFKYTDQNSEAVNRFKGGRIKLARVDEGTSRFWVNFDNIIVTNGKLQSTLRRSPKKLYVSQSTGDDSFEGTEAKPFKTISKAIESSYPGDEIIVEDGVYGDQIKFQSNRIYGEEGKRLTLRPRNRHKATISGANLKYGDFVTIDGFEVIDQSVQVGGSTGTEVLNNYIHDVGTGIKANGVNGKVAGNYILRINMGITVSGSNMLVENNELERLIWTSGDSDYFRFFGEGHVIRGNYMHGTREEEIGKAHVDGFQTFDNNGEYARRIIIEGNLIEDFYHQGFMGSGSYYYHSYDITFRNNIFKDAAAWGMCISTLKDVKVYNNLFINMKIHGVGFRGTEEKPATGEVRNNIFYNARNCYFGLDKYHYESGNNLLFYSDPYKKYDQDRFPNDIVNADPLFIDIDNNDFSLHPNSPAVDSGISLDFSDDFAGNKRPFGNGWDIGPYEYQGNSLPVAHIQFFNVVNSTSGYEPFKVMFDGSSSYAPEDRSIVSYDWDFGDGDTGSGAIVNHTFAAGEYNVRLTVTDDAGNGHTAAREFNILPSEFPSLYLYLPFNKDCLDASGKNMTVDIGENIRFENSSFYRSIRFDNNESRGISVKHNNYLDGLDGITIALLAKKDSKDTAATVIHKHTVYGMSITANGFSGSISTDTESKKISAAKVVDDTDWHHYAMTYNGSAIVLYLDGVECSRVECTGKIRRDASRDIVIGRNPWRDSFEGLIDEIRIYDRALSEDEIKQIMEGKENLITTDYSEMVRILELLYESADISDNSLNPTYGAAMKRDLVVTLTAGYQDQLRDAAKLTFSDIWGGEWYASHIPMAVYLKLINGFPDGSFKGGSLISRAEVLTMLARFNNSEDLIKQKAEQDPESLNRIAEQIGNDWYTHYVAYAKDGLVYPDLYTRETIQKPMIRGEVIHALANFLWGEELQAGGKYYILAEMNENPSFNDTVKTIYIANPDSGNNGSKSYLWYKQLMDAAANPENGVPMDFYPSIICLKDKGILLGNSGDSRWYDPITRAEALALFERLAKVWGEESSKPD